MGFKLILNLKFQPEGGTPIVVKLLGDSPACQGSLFPWAGFLERKHSFSDQERVIRSNERGGRIQSQLIQSAAFKSRYIVFKRECALFLFYFQLQRAFNINLYWGQVASTVVYNRILYTVTPMFQVPTCRQTQLPPRC